MDLTNSNSLLEKAETIPSLTLAFSRHPIHWCGEFPIYTKSARGSHFVDVDENVYFNYLCGLGQVVLGYAYKKDCEKFHGFLINQ